jgi:hypothetical protein
VQQDLSVSCRRDRNLLKNKINLSMSNVRLQSRSYLGTDTGLDSEHASRDGPVVCSLPRTCARNFSINMCRDPIHDILIHSAKIDQVYNVPAYFAHAG